MKSQPLYAATILRLALGVMYLSHGLMKLLVFTPAGTAGFFASLGLPEILGPITMAAEIVGGLLLICGWHSRWVAAALMPVLVGAVVLVHGVNGWAFGNPGGGWEYPAFLLAASVAVFCLGNGAWALPWGQQTAPLNRNMG